MRRDESGYVTVEHAVGFVAVTLMIGVIVAVAQAGVTGSSLCQAVREGARAASIGAQDPQAAARAAYAPGTYAVTRSGGWVSVAELQCPDCTRPHRPQVTDNDSQRMGAHQLTP